ncbi:MAG: LytR/AlgR family response regulator transcription factor [Gammaproteobacteria bacterium]
MIRALMIYPDNKNRQQFLSALAQEKNITLIADCVYGDDAMQKIQSLRPDVVFASTEAPGLPSLTALIWSGFAKRPHLVVISDCERYAIEAFAINATDYLLAPVTQARLAVTMHKLRQKIEQEQCIDRRLDIDTLVRYLQECVEKAQPKRQDERVSVNFGGRFRFLNMSYIRYLLADADYTDVHMTTGEVLHSTSRISEMGSKLPDDRFLRIRRSTIVNIECVREVRAYKDKHEVVMDDGMTFKPGSTYKSKIKAALVKGAVHEHKGLANLPERAA